MKRIAVLMFVAAMAAPGAFAQADAEEQVRQAERERLAALTSGELAVLERYLSDDLLYTHSSARVETKEEFLAALRSGELKYEAMNHEDLKVRVYGDMALLTGRSAVRVRSRGQENNLQIRFLAVYVRKAGRWQMAAWQSTRFPQP